MKQIIALAVGRKWGDYMKAVLLSIKPQYCELIASGKKIIEVRKSEPKLKPPFKCYIYQTKDKQYCTELRAIKELDHALSIEENVGKVIGEFVCDRIEIFDVPYPAYSYEMRKDIQDLSGLGYFQLHKYANHKYRSLYAWYISNLVIYDKPKELSEFRKPGGRQCVSDNGRFCKYIQASPGDDPADANTMSCIYGEQNCPFEHLNHPPQSWCYVEELE